MDVSALGVGLSAAAVGVFTWSLVRERQGRSLLGPRAPGALPLTSIALGLALLLWCALRFLLPAFVPVDAAGPGGATFYAAATNALVAVFVMRFAIAGPRRPVVGPARVAATGVAVGLVVLGCAQALTLGLAAAYEAAGRPLPEQEAVTLLRDAGVETRLLVAVASVVLAPFAEEVFFRGVVLPSLAPALGESRAVLAQAAVFGFLHFPTDPVRWPLVLPLVLVGWAFGQAYARTGSLVLVIVAHAVFNGVQVTLLLLG